MSDIKTDAYHFLALYNKLITIPWFTIIALITLNVCINLKESIEQSQSVS